jgi:hypothetical protein
LLIDKRKKGSAVNHPRRRRISELLCLNLWDGVCGSA